MDNCSIIWWWSHLNYKHTGFLEELRNSHDVRIPNSLTNYEYYHKDMSCHLIFFITEATKFYVSFTHLKEMLFKRTEQISFNSPNSCSMSVRISLYILSEMYIYIFSHGLTSENYKLCKWLTFPPSLPGTSKNGLGPIIWDMVISSHSDHNFIVSISSWQNRYQDILTF